MLVELILDKLGFFYDDIVKKKHGNCSEITYGFLIKTIIEDKGNSSAYTLFPMGQQTFHRMMKRAFPEVKLNGGQETWAYYFLSLINHKNCGSCNAIKPFTEFNKDKSNSKLGLSATCKECVKTQQQDQYNKYLQSHKRSQEKNKDKIYARNALYRAERKLRVPSWSDLAKIEEIYAKCPPGYHVDHELPLKGEFVSGLHVPENLQYLPELANLAKGNRVDLEEYNKKYYNT